MIRKVAAAVAVNAALIGGLVLVPALAHGHSTGNDSKSHTISTTSNSAGGYGYGYGTERPGWGYGDKNHIHIGPPGLLQSQSNDSGDATSTPATDSTGD